MGNSGIIGKTKRIIGSGLEYCSYAFFMKIPCTETYVILIIADNIPFNVSKTLQLEIDCSL